MFHDDLQALVDQIYDEEGRLQPQIQLRLNIITGRRLTRSTAAPIEAAGHLRGLDALCANVEDPVSLQPIRPLLRITLQTGQRTHCFDAIPLLRHIATGTIELHAAGFGMFSLIETGEDLPAPRHPMTNLPLSLDDLDDIIAQARNIANLLRVLVD